MDEEIMNSSDEDQTNEGMVNPVDVDQMSRETLQNMDVSDESSDGGTSHIMVAADVLPLVARISNGKCCVDDAPGYVTHLRLGAVATECNSESDWIRLNWDGEALHNILWIGCLTGSINGGNLDFIDYEDYTALSALDKEALDNVFENERCRPVFLKKAQRIQWRKFHCLVLRPLLHSSGFSLQNILNIDDCFDAYRDTCLAFSKTLTSASPEEQTILVLDSHLMLLPKVVTSEHPERKVGWFCQTPFPQYGVLETLPGLSELLDGVLHAHLIGFCTSNDVLNFQSTCRRSLNAVPTKEIGIETTRAILVYNQRDVHVAVLPLGIHLDKCAVGRLLVPECIQKLEEICKEASKVIVSVNDMDQNEGILEQLLAFEHLLKDAQWRGKVVLILMVNALETSIQEYFGELRESIRDLVERINREYCSGDFLPVVFSEKIWELPHIVRLYREADLYLATPVRDGMNLTAQEFLGCQYSNMLGRLSGDNRAKIIMSKFSGAAAFIKGIDSHVNPRETKDFARKMANKLEEDVSGGSLGHAMRSLKKCRPEAWLCQILVMLRDPKTM